MTTNDGGPAFPATWWERDSMGNIAPRCFNAGMTLHQWYAGLAMLGLLIIDGRKEGTQWISMGALDQADAMLMEYERREIADYESRGEPNTIVPTTPPPRGREERT